MALTDQKITSIAVCVVRNAADIIALTVLHHLLTGVDLCVVVDNGSTDGTTDILKSIARKSGRLRLVEDAGPFDQGKFTTTAVNEFTRHGEVLVIPFDSDEFWDCSVAALRRQMTDIGANVLECEWKNFIQSRSVVAPTSWSWLRASRRTHVVETGGRGSVKGHQNSFVQIRFPPKVVFQASGDVRMKKGSHIAKFAGAKTAACNDVFCLHLPLRSQFELVKRAAHEVRHSELRTSSRDTWQSTYWHQEVESGHTGREWRANSYDRSGKLDVFGRDVATFRDLRLVRLLARASLYAGYLNIRSLVTKG